MTYVCLLGDGNADIISGSSIVREYEELYRAISKKDCRELIIKDDFAKKFFTPSGLSQLIEDIHRINPVCRVIINKDLIKSFDRDVEFILALKTSEDLINFLLNNRVDGFQLIQKLARDYNSTYTEALQANNKLSTMHLEVSEYIQKCDIEKDRREKLSEQLAVTASKLDTLTSRIKFSYGKNIDSEHLLGYNVDVTSYRKIIYIKEITRVRYIDTFMYYLQEITKTLNNIPTRYVVIEAPYAYGRSKLYPTCLPHLDLTYRDVYKSDIFMAGFQQTLMGDILKNPSNVQFLLVLDRSGADNCFVRGNSVETFFTASDVHDFPDGITNDRAISYRKELLHIPYIKNFDELAMEERISRYSSFEIMKYILGVMNGVS